MRPSRSEVLMNVAETIAFRGTCDRKQVGAVIAREGRIVSVGYNGAPPGLPHCGANQHGYLGSAEHAGLDVNDLIDRFGCRNATHAEANALAFAAKYGVATDEAELYVTVSPCENCARLLIAAGIVTVTFREMYRDNAGMHLLEKAGITLFSMHGLTKLHES